MTLQEYDALYRNMLVKKMRIVTSGGITILNKNIAQEEMSLEESLCSEENLRFGTCEASCFTVRIVYSDHSFVGEWLDVYQKIYTDSDGFLLNEDGTFLLNETGGRIQLESEADGIAYYGRFKVFSDKPTNDRLYRDLVCYDMMYDILNADVTEWSQNLTFPMTVKDFRDSFFEEIGVVQEETTLINDDFEIEGQYIVEASLSGKTIVESICELNGVFGHINKDGKFEYISLPSTESLVYPYYVDGSGSYEDYETEEITGVVARSEQGDVGVMVGTYDNVYNIDYNPLLFGSETKPSMTTALTNLLNHISQFTYRPFNITTYGNPMLPLGTNVTFNTRHQTVTSFVMNRFLNGLQGLRDSLSARGNLTYPSDVNAVRSEIKRSGGLTHKLVNEVDKFESEIYNEDGSSKIEQSLETVVLKVDNNGKLVKAELGVNASQGSVFTINANYINIESDTIKFDNNGYSVKGDVYETIIKPDDFNVVANYPTDATYLADMPRYYYDISKNVQKRFMGYSGYEVSTTEGYEKTFPPGHDPSERYYNWYTEANTAAYNCLLLSSPHTYAWDGHYWTGTGISHFVREQDGSSYAYFAIVGQHNVLFPSAWSALLADGATIDEDGYLVMPDNDKTLDYYMNNQGYSHHFSMGTHGYNENNTEHIGFVKVHYEDFKIGAPEGFPVTNEYGEDYLFAVQPSMTISEEDLYDFSGYYWGKTVLGRTSLKNTISGLQVQSSSDKRLKRDIEEVDERLIKAICECKTYQFKFYNEDVTTVGIIAQDFVEACEKYGIDPDGYSLCQKRTVKDNDDTEYYYIEYSQYLTLKSIHLQNQIDELKELMNK